MTNFLQRYPISIWPLIFALIMLILAALGLEVRNALRLDSAVIGDGHWWRFITAHWVHIGWEHALLNIAGFILVSWLQPKAHWASWLLFYLIASVLTSAYLISHSKIGTYVGASGVLHGLLILGAYSSQWLDAKRKFLMILAITLKLIWEQSPLYQGDSIEHLIGARVAVDAHFIGGICGLFVVLILLIKKRQKLNS